MPALGPTSRIFPEGMPAKTMIRVLRKDARFTVKGLAAAMGVTFQSVKNWEAGRSFPNNLERLFQVLGLSLAEREALLKARRGRS